MKDSESLRSTGPRRFAKSLGPGFLVLIGLALWFGLRVVVDKSGDSNLTRDANSCGKIDRIKPSIELALESLDMILHDKDYKKASVKRLQGAVRIPTVVQDINPDPMEDIEYYNRFFEFHKYLEKQFPLVYRELTVEKVNEVGLLYTWEGSDSSLKPLLLTAHQDVVPVNSATLEQWKYPPFEGHYDEESDLLYGRGSNDCKNLLIAELEAIEQLVDDGFKPNRTLIVALGFDEEASGTWGAGSLSKFITDRYGDDSMYAIIDEGEGLTRLSDDVLVATPINAEKGYVDVQISIMGQGGHSSLPPDHTTIGIAAELISLIENNQYDLEFHTDHPMYGLLRCVAEHSDLFDPKTKKAVIRAPKCKKQAAYLQEFLASSKLLRDTIRSTIAVDIIQGGVKANALPESTTFLVNHRVDIEFKVQDVVDRDLQTVMDVAKKFSYGVIYDNKTYLEPTDNGYIKLEALRALEPAPRSPNSGPVWDLLAGTITDLFESRVFGDDELDVYVTTTLFSGNTDTKYYWNLSKNIYRFIGSIVDPKILKTLHSVNEHVDMPGHLSAIAFVYEYIVNVNEYASN